MLSLLLGGHPDRLAPPPTRLLDAHVVGDHEFTAEIPYVVLNDAMVLRVKSGHDRIVIRKRLRRERRDHPLCPHAVASERLHRWRFKLIDIVVPKTVERNEDDGRFEVTDRPLGSD